MKCPKTWWLMFNEICLVEIWRAHQTERSGFGKTPGSSPRLLVQGWGQKGASLSPRRICRGSCGKWCCRRKRDRRQEHWKGGWGGPICVAGKGGWISINWGTCDKTGVGGDKPGDLWECGEDGIRESSWKEVGWIFDESQTQMLSGTLRGKRHMRDSYRNKPCWGCGCIRRWEESPTAMESRPWRPWPHSTLTCTRGGYFVPSVSPGSENTYSFRSRNI